MNKLALALVAVLFVVGAVAIDPGDEATEDFESFSPGASLPSGDFYSTSTAGGFSVSSTGGVGNSQSLHHTGAKPLQSHFTLGASYQLDYGTVGAHITVIDNPGNTGDRSRVLFHSNDGIMRDFEIYPDESVFKGDGTGQLVSAGSCSFPQHFEFTSVDYGAATYTLTIRDSAGASCHSGSASFQTAGSPSGFLRVSIYNNGNAAQGSVKIDDLFFGGPGFAVPGAPFTCDGALECARLDQTAEAAGIPAAALYWMIGVLLMVVFAAGGYKLTTGNAAGGVVGGFAGLGVSVAFGLIPFWFVLLALTGGLTVLVLGARNGS